MINDENYTEYNSDRRKKAVYFDMKMAKISLPKEGFTYMPNERCEMYTIGGEEMFAGSKIDTADMPKDVNRGRHRIYTGGKYDSFLYLPVIPEKE